jgi:ATP-binding cassette subfamily B protein
VQRAIELVGADQFIDQLPGGLDYQVGERGMSLSAGQRQLISFIRVMVYDPQVLLLDEATASIDTETEILVERAIAKVLSNRTSIIIAHRLSTIQRADQILVMHKGRIIERGTHQELLAYGGHYKKLYLLQYGKAEPV